MLNKRLIELVPNALTHVAKNVLLQILGLLSSIVLMFTAGFFLHDLLFGRSASFPFWQAVCVIVGCIFVRVVCVYFAQRQSYLASKSVKRVLRTSIYDKVIALGGRYGKKLSTAELLQISVEGVEQLETYFSGYLPQMFYALISPLILFFALSFVSFKVAVVLFICVPFIPISIIAVNKIAKRLLAKYWGEYTGLADNFLDNLQGLNTLKIYSSDAHMHAKMNAQAERFRVVTMKVLSMQLNSIILMDIIAYGGAALGILFAILEYSAGNIGFVGCFAIIMLCADFFLPLRLLGSFFHIAMNGMAASKKIFDLLDIAPEKEKTQTMQDSDITIQNLWFSYDGEANVLKDISLEIPKNSFVAVVGQSGCGKSTLAGILCGEHTQYSGSVALGGTELADITRQSLAQNICTITAAAYIFKGTVRDNLCMAKANADDSELWDVLASVNLADFLKGEQGLDTSLDERGSNLSGGQCQRLALARALLHSGDIYILDEATSNIDVESENDIMQALQALAKTKTVILISHRLANVVSCSDIYVLESGRLAEKGTHKQLLAQSGVYERLWSSQQQLENIGKEGGAV